MRDLALLPSSPMVTSLLAMAEFFLSQHPLPVSEAVHCLLAVLAQQPVARVEASVRLRLGVVLSEHTSCVVEAREHLEKAVSGRGGREEGGEAVRCVSLSRCWWRGQLQTFKM